MPSRGWRARWRRVGIVGLLGVAAMGVFAAEAQAYISGDLIYARRVGTSASEAGAYALAAGPDGVTAVAGWKYVAGVGKVPMVAKYSVSGERLWLKTYPDLGPSAAVKVVIDAYGSVYVAAVRGDTDASAWDIVLLRYGSAGTFKWARAYDGPAGDMDCPRALLIDKVGNIIVVGNSRATDETMGLVILKYNRAGEMLWTEPVRLDPDPADADAGAIEVYDAARDAEGNIYVAGSSAYRVAGEWIESALMLKFAGADGSKVWGHVYESAVQPESHFRQVAVRGTLVVGVGSTHPDPEDALVVRYNTSGVLKYWREWGRGNATSEWYGDVVIDGSYNVYVTGKQAGDTYQQAVTMKLRPDLTTAWKATYLPSSDRAWGVYLARNSLGNVYMAGQKWTLAGLADFLTIKYSATGVRQWVRVWSAGGPGDDGLFGLALGTAGGVYVAGEVTNKDDFLQAVLLKYKL